MAGQSAGRGDHGDPHPVECFDEIFDLFAWSAGDGGIDHFPHADAHGPDLPHRHAAVGEKSLIDRQPGLELSEHLFVVRGDHPASDAGVLPAAHVEDIGLGRHFLDDLGDGLVRVSLFPLPDEIGVLREQAAVQDQDEAVLIADLADLFEVGHGERLPAEKVGRGLHADEPDLVLAPFLDRILELLDVHVPLERMRALGFQGLVRVELQADGLAGHFDMGLGRGEMVVRDRHPARLAEDLGQKMFRRPSLVDVHHVLIPQDVLDDIGEIVERLAPGIGVVGVHEGRVLVVAHGVDAAVRQHVQVDVPRSEKESVVPGFLDGLEPVLGRNERDLLDHPGLVHLDGQFLAVR